MPKISKQDRLRMLARIACSVAWLPLSAKEFDALTLKHPALAERLSKLRRYVLRNVDNSADSDALTFDDIGDYDLQELNITETGRTFEATVNDREYSGTFEVRCPAEEMPSLRDLRIYGPEPTEQTAATECTDLLLYEVIMRAVHSHIAHNAAGYLNEYCNREES